MSNIVVYESKYGSTERYAKWIAKELNCKISKLSETNIDELKNYDNIIYGGWIHAGKLEGFNKIQENADNLKNKNLIVFSVGLSKTEDPIYKNFKDKNFKDFNNLQHFYLRGAFNFNNFTFKDKIMMGIFKLLIKIKKADAENKDILEAYDKPVDYTNKENIKHIVKAVKNLS